MRWRGVRLVMGSWKIMVISLPLICRRSDGVTFLRSLPSNIMLPSVTLIWFLSRSWRASAVMLLPQPDSPTIPTISPFPTVKLMRLTTLYSSPFSYSVTVMCFTSRMFSPICRFLYSQIHSLYPKNISCGPLIQPGPDAACGFFLFYSQLRYYLSARIVALSSYIFSQLRYFLRMPSPMQLRPTIVTTIISPGARAAQGVEKIMSCASLSIRPQLGIGG